MENSSRKRTTGDRVRDAALALVVLAMVSQLIPVTFAAWDKTKPANNSALVSSEIRANWDAIEAAFGNLSTTPLVQIQTDFAAGSRLGGPFTFKPGGVSTYDATISGRIHSNTTQVGNIGGGADDLQTYTLPATTLSADGKVLRITVEGTTAANANNKTYEYLIGATAITFRGPTADNDGRWVMNIVVTRTGAATGRYFGVFTLQAAAGTANSVQSGTTAETWANAITIKGRGTGTADNDIVMRTHIVEVVG